jgi:hypothetical protein
MAYITKLVYQGGGFLVGVPARDLTLDEAKRHRGKAFLVRTGLYREVRIKIPAIQKATPEAIEESHYGTGN